MITFTVLATVTKRLYCYCSNVANINETSLGISSRYIKSSLSFYKMAIKSYEILHKEVWPQKCKRYSRFFYNLLSLSVQTTGRDPWFYISSQYRLFYNIFYSSVLCFT